MELDGSVAGDRAVAARQPRDRRNDGVDAVSVVPRSPGAKAKRGERRIEQIFTGGPAPLMRQLFHAANFLGRTRNRLRNGKYSREPLTLLRFEWKGDKVECDWLMRPPDPWDRDLPLHIARDNQTLQALDDAMSLRDAIFKTFPAVTIARLQMFRTDAEQQLELVLTGNVSRNNEVLQRVASMVMRARLCGFQFNLQEGGLGTLSAMR